MLNNDPHKLRFLGINMHSRTRRRVAVVLTYVVSYVISLVVDARVWDGWGYPFVVLWVLSAAVAFGGIFRNGGLVKSFDVPKPPRAGAMMIVGSLDEWARYKYGTPSFEESSAEQQEELLAAYRVGNYLVPQDKLHAAYGLPDEREAMQRDQASRRTLVWLSSYITYVAASYSVRHGKVDSLDIVTTLVSMGVLALTLPKAMVLWEEPDPDGAPMTLVERTAK